MEKGQEGSQDCEFGCPSSQKHSLAILNCFTCEVQVQVLPETWSEKEGRKEGRQGMSVLRAHVLS